MTAIHTQLIYPMFAMVLLTVAVLSVMFLRRVSALRAGKIKMAHFRTFSVGEAPEPAVQAARHFVNLFEMPTLFYVACVIGMILPVQGWTFLGFAWLFVAARVAHALIHLGSNKVIPRMWSYATGVTCAVIMWIIIFIKALTIGVANV